MTDSLDNEPAFVDTVDPHQARQGRREALAYATNLLGHQEDPNVYKLLEAADAIDKYLEDGSVATYSE